MKDQGWFTGDKAREVAVVKDGDDVGHHNGGFSTSLLFAPESFSRPPASHGPSPSAGTEPCGTEAAEPSSLQDGNRDGGNSATRHYLRQFMISSSLFLSQKPATAAGGACLRPSRPMTGGTAVPPVTGGNGRSAAPRGSVAPSMPTRPASAQPYGSTATATRAEQVSTGVARPSAYVLRRPRRHSASATTAAGSKGCPTGPSTTTTTTTTLHPQRSTSAEAGGDSPLLNGSAPVLPSPPAPPVVRVCVRRLVRPSSSSSDAAARGPPQGRTRTAEMNTAAAMPKVTLSRRPVLLCRPAAYGASKADIDAVGAGRRADERAEENGTATVPAPRFRRPPLSPEALAALSSAEAEEERIPAHRDGNHDSSSGGVFVPPSLPTPWAFGRTESVANTSTSPSAPARGRRRRSSSSPSSSAPPTAAAIDANGSDGTRNDSPSVSSKPTAECHGSEVLLSEKAALPASPCASAMADCPSSFLGSDPSSPATPFSRTTANSLREKGNAYFRKRDYRNALRVYTEALHVDQGNAVIGCNRASVYLLTGQYTAALVECRRVLLNDPGNMKAHWRAGKALLHLGKLPEARRHYRAARQAAEAANQPPLSLSGRAASGVGATVSGHAHQMKWLRERRAVQVEEAALDAFDKYMSCLKQGQFADAQEYLTVCISAFCGGGGGGCEVAARGLGSAPWRARMSEVGVHTDPHRALEAIKDLKRECHGGGPAVPPDTDVTTPTGSSPLGHFLGADLDYVHAKALFFCAHDAASTALCLRLLEAASQKLRTQQAIVEENIRQYAAWARGSVAAAETSLGTAAAAAPVVFDAEAWLNAYRVEEDSRIAELRQTIRQFEHFRDRGNAAYLGGQWAVAYDAYAACLRLGGHNKSLLSTTHCNRSAVCMQANRWADALHDASEAVRCNDKNDKAYARRARIHLHLYHDLRERTREREAEGWRGPAAAAATPAVLQRHLDGAVEDLRRCVELLATVPGERQAAEEQLTSAQRVRQEYLFARSRHPTAAASPPSPPPRARAGSGSSGGAWGNTEVPRGFFSSSNFSRGTRSSGDGAAGQERGRAAPTAAALSAAAAAARHLAVLGLPTHTAQVEVAVLTRAYRKAALQWHPDKWVCGTEAERAVAEGHFKEVNVAYQTLRESATS